jgi:spore coat polysaccharide biosynthesis protein SpsF
MSFNTDQEKFWAGDFGDEYIQRNSGKDLLASNLNFFSNSIKKTTNITSCIEFGANIGMNLKAFQLLFPKLDLYAIEINEQASNKLEEIIPNNNIYKQSIIDFLPKQQWDLVLIKGVLIHIDPQHLQKVYKNLYGASKKYILLCEYYNRTPVKVEYRGFKDKLFKRDFCGELMDKFNDLQLLDYGFAYHRDENFPQDDISWFLLKKGEL